MLLVHILAYVTSSQVLLKSVTLVYILDSIATFSRTILKRKYENESPCRNQTYVSKLSDMVFPILT